MNSFIKILLPLLLSFELIGAVPTVEGLFRNSSNKEISSEGIVVSYSIEEQQNDLLLQKTEMETGEGKLEGEMLKEKLGPVFVRESLLFSEDRLNVQSIKYVYNSGEMKSSSMVQFKYLPSYSGKINSELNIDKKVLYALSSMYLFNDSSLIGNILQEKGNGYRKNKDLLEPEKIKLLERYKEYLIATKEDPDLREELSSPLNPTDLEERGRVLDLMKKNMYQREETVNLIKVQDEFRWKVDLGSIKAEFTNDGHRLKNFSMQANGLIEVTTGDYILFDGIHELPKVLIFKGSNDRVYKIRFLSLKHFQNYKKTFTQEKNKLSQIEKEIRESGEIYNEHPLVL